MKKVLVIAYYFPPTAGGGVQRAAKFVKYLPSFGWDPVVLTVSNPDFDLFDESLMNDISAQVKVHRAYSFDPVRWHRKRKHGEASLFDRKEKVSDNSWGKRLENPVTLSVKALKYLLNNFVLVPDDYVGWIPIAVIKGYTVMKRERVDAIYATGKPWSSFLIAYLLGIFTGKPFILDLRDPWTLTPYDGSGGKTPKHRIWSFLEKICFSRAGKVININEQITRAYISHYPSIPPERFTCITHGFDTDDFPGGSRVDGEDKFSITYVGTLYRNTLPDNFLKSVSQLISQHPDLKEEIRLRFVGFVPSYVCRLINELRLENAVDLVGYLPHRESIKLMTSAAVLLLLLNKPESNTEAQVSTGKLFEYLASRRPILALIPPETDAARLIKEQQAGTVIDPDDMEGIEKAILSFWQQYKQGGVRPTSPTLEKFERKHLAGQLADILDSLSPAVHHPVVSDDYR